jgi:hypothetical protein
MLNIAQNMQNGYTTYSVYSVPTIAKITFPNYNSENR